MRIIQASLCLRFYTANGWTRVAVANLLKDDLRVSRVMPRYFDDRDNVGHGTFELDDDLSHSECDYFAVYDKCDPFSSNFMERHEIVRGY